MVRKKYLAFCTVRHILKDNDTEYTVVVFSYNKKRRSCDTKTLVLNKEEIAKFMLDGRYILANGSLRNGKSPIVRGYYCDRESSIIRKTLEVTREIMEYNYGDKPGCLLDNRDEAIAIIRDTLITMKVPNVSVVDCNIKLPNGSWIKHKLLRANDMYLDIIAEQFNEAFSDRDKYKKIIMSRIVPKNMEIVGIAK